MSLKFFFSFLLKNFCIFSVSIKGFYFNYSMFLREFFFPTFVLFSILFPLFIIPTNFRRCVYFSLFFSCSCHFHIFHLFLHKCSSKYFLLNECYMVELILRALFMEFILYTSFFKMIIFKCRKIV